jgi:hypothetical protein
VESRKLSFFLLFRAFQRPSEDEDELEEDVEIAVPNPRLPGDRETGRALASPAAANSLRNSKASVSGLLMVS